MWKDSSEKREASARDTLKVPENSQQFPYLALRTGFLDSNGYWIWDFWVMVSWWSHLSSYPRFTTGHYNIKKSIYFAKLNLWLEMKPANFLVIEVCSLFNTTSIKKPILIRYLLMFDMQNYFGEYLFFGC